MKYIIDPLGEIKLMTTIVNAQSWKCHFLVKFRHKNKLVKVRLKHLADWMFKSNCHDST